MDSPRPEGERESSRGDASKTMEPILLKYLEEAALEDKELKERWTETLNILLIFGGLLFATITAFAIAVQPHIEADPMSGTNAILLQILQRLDNGTTIVHPEYPDAPFNATNVLAWWYASLSCSMASIFGALLAKQWIMHYETHRFWASTPEDRAVLRESRYQGLARWGFYGVFEAFTILLQISLLLFVIGLTEYLHPSPLLAHIIISFLAITGTFYLITLLAGTIFPSCPFKSPLTNFLGRATGTLFWRALRTLARTALFLTYPIRLIFKWKFFDPVRPSNRANLGLHHLGASVEVWMGKLSCFERESCYTGILWSQLQRLDGINDFAVEELTVAVDAFISLPFKTGAKALLQQDTYPLWHQNAIRILGLHPNPTRSLLPRFDLLCHMVYHFPNLANLTRVYAAIYGKLDMEDKQATWGHIVGIFRQSWKTGGPDGLLYLPVQHMRPSTVAAYLTFQLHHWSYQTPDERIHIYLLFTELPVILGATWLPTALPTVAADAITVLSLILYGMEPLAAPQLQTLLKEDPLERLFQALDRLSHYPAEQRPHKLISMALNVSSELIVNWKGTLDQASWKDGRLMASLFRLLELGQSWRHPKSAWLREADGASCGALLLSATQTLIYHVIQHTGTLGGVPQVPDMLLKGLDDNFATIAPPTELSPLVSESSLSLLHCVLSIRLARTPPSPRFIFSSIFRPRSLPAQISSSLSRDSLVSLLHKYPQVVHQLIRYIRESREQRVVILSILVRGRDVWFSPIISPMLVQHNQILSDLAALAKLLPKSAGYLPMDALVGFRGKWDALLLALTDLEGALLAEDEKRAQVEALDQSNSENCEPDGGILPSQQIGLFPRPGSAGATQIPDPWCRPPVPGNSLQPEVPAPSVDMFGQASALEMQTWTRGDE